MDFERLQLPNLEEDDNLESVKEKLDKSAEKLLKFLQENYNTVRLSVETNYKNVYEAGGKRIENVDFLKKQYLHFFASAVKLISKQNESRALVKIINQFD